MSASGLGEVIDTLYSARKATQKLRNYPRAAIGLGLEGINLGSETGELTLVYIADPHNRVLIFDIFKNPGIVHEGGLADLLRCENITKVVHDSHVVSAMFYWRYGVILKNVFDTQVAHGLIPRITPYGDTNISLQHIQLASLDDVCNKHGISSTKNGTLRHKLDHDKQFCKVRPLKPDMVEYAMASVTVLLPLHKRLVSCIPEEFQPILHQLCHQRLFRKSDNLFRVQPGYLQ